MTSGARKLCFLVVMTVYRNDNFLVAIPASAFQNRSIMGRNYDRLVEAADGESPGVTQAVQKFIDILARHRFRRVTIVTACRAAVA